MSNVFEERLREAKDNPVAYEDRYLAFVDILGWKNVVKLSEKDPRLLSDASYAAELIRVTKDWVLNTNKGLIDLPEGGFDLDIRVSHFSDCFVFSLPVNPTSEVISNFLKTVSRQLLDSGYYTRGAIVRGAVRHSQDGGVLYGPAMNDAYGLETTTAIYSRIIVAESAVARNPAD